MPAIPVPVQLSILLALACLSTSCQDTNRDMATHDDAANSDGPCCPIDPLPSGCMQLGGTRPQSGCSVTCDFFCSTDWQVVTDENGCSLWKYRVRAPLPGETSLCTPLRDGGNDASTDRDAASKVE